MTVRVFRSPRAGIEIEEIATYLAAHSPSAAQRFLQSLERAQQLLSPTQERRVSAQAPAA
jgi:plasmid stabilization system protein ParE